MPATKIVRVVRAQVQCSFPIASSEVGMPSVLNLLIRVRFGYGEHVSQVDQLVVDNGAGGVSYRFDPPTSAIESVCEQSHQELH